MKFNIRTCIITKKKYSKSELLRFSVNDNKIVINGKTGKGYYIYPSYKNYDILLKTKLLNKKLEIDISIEEYISWKQWFTN